MDWLDDVIARLFAKRSSLDQSLLLYLLIGIFGIVCATLITVSICVSWERLILMPEEEPTFFWNYLTWAPPSTSLPTIKLLEMVRQSAVFVYSFLGIFFATKMFYRKRILQPITILEKSIQQIEQGNYQQPVYYNTYDEFEKTSLGLEHLRLTLQTNEKKLKEMYRDQKKVNAAFSHDLRTPLATIQNNLELLEAYYEQDCLSPEAFDKSATKIKNSIIRLSSFSETMQQLQKLEDRPLYKKMQPLSLIEEHIREIDQHYPENEVVENLLNNAYRFAKQTIDITIALQEQLVIIYVKDDGPGFSKKELLTATEPYYSQNKNSHFGLGLTIAEALAQKHGGQLKIANSLDSGAIVSAVFLLD